MAGTGHKRRKTTAPPPVESSPLTAPASTPEERNAYLRSIGTERMKEVNEHNGHNSLGGGGRWSLATFRHTRMFVSFGEEGGGVRGR